MELAAEGSDFSQQANECPLCDVCKHHHLQGVKCTICGHVGRSNVLARMKVSAMQL